MSDFTWAMPNHGKGGRHTIDGEKRSAAIAIRVTPRVRALLDEAAKHNGRSLTSEVQSRLELSLAGDVLDDWMPPRISRQR